MKTGTSSDKESLETPIPAAHAKQRRCLSCELVFVSVWAGERVCKKCKQSSAWHAGVAYKSV